MIYQKERPRTFDAVLGQEYIVENIRSQSIRNSWFNVYILSGQFGSGKTSIAYIIALSANCDHKDENGNPCLKCEKCREILSNGLDFWEIDGADNSSVEDIRKLKEYVGFLPTRQRWKVIIIDEVHMLSKSAFNCLLKLLENPPAYVIIILCTTELRVIPMTVRSRAATYSFKRIPHKAIIEGLRRSAPKYGLTVDEAACNLIAHYSDGSMRNAYMLLEQVSVVTHDIDEKACMDILGIIDEDGVNRIIGMMLDRNLAGFLEQLDTMEQTGKSFSLLATDLLKACADLVMASCGCGERVGGTSYYQGEIIRMAGEHELHDICTLSSLLRDIRKYTESGSKYDFVIFMISVFENLQSVYDRLDYLEQMVSQGISQRKDAVVTVCQEPLDDERQDQGIQSLEEGLDIDRKDYHVPTSDGMQPGGVKDEENQAIPILSEDEGDDFFDDLFSESNQGAYQQYGAEGDDKSSWSDIDEPPFDRSSTDTFNGFGANQSNPGLHITDDGFGEDGRSGQLQATVEPEAENTETLGGRTPAQMAKEVFEEAIATEPILLSKYMMSCVVEETPEGINVITQDQGTTTQLLMFISNMGIVHVDVQYRQPID